MGTWGYRLYEDDITLDVRDTFTDYMREGDTLEEAIGKISSAFHLDGDPKEDPDVEKGWFAIADVLWRYGRLTPEIKEKALSFLKDSEDLKFWEEDNPELAPKRKKELKKLKAKLESEQPPQKKFGKKREIKEYVCPWKIGDVYAYPMVGEASQGTEFYGRYAVCIKVDTVFKGDYYPVVWIKLTKDNQLPRTVEEINELEFVQFRYPCNHPLKFDREEFEADYAFWKIDLPSEEEIAKIAEEYNRKQEERFDHSLDYLNDKNGNLHVYRAYLYNTSKRATPKSLIYLGNFQVSPPPMEYRIDNNELFSTGHWKYFEELLIKDYTENKAYNESVGWPEDYL